MEMGSSETSQGVGACSVCVCACARMPKGQHVVREVHFF